MEELLSNWDSVEIDHAPLAYLPKQFESGQEEMRRDTFEGRIVVQDRFVSIHALDKVVMRFSQAGAAIKRRSRTRPGTASNPSCPE
jgi:hypothetical protein